jgi:hypothetical protein
LSSLYYQALDTMEKRPMLFGYKYFVAFVFENSVLLESTEAK